MMQKSNENITLPGREALFILGEIEYLLISLRNIGNYYYHDGEEVKSVRSAYCAETTRFIDEQKITHRLAKLRMVLTEKFDSSLGEDDMDDVERAMEDVRGWEKPGD
jgi:hypothetical protein